MHLSRRLQRVAANVCSGGVVADIGCDHGFTSIYLVQENKAVSAIAMDVNQGPLKRAKEHILQYGMSDRITLRLSDGLLKLMPGEADTLLISGMGGALIARILTDGSEVAAAAKELVLSPQSEAFLVRKCVNRLGFQIASEEMLADAYINETYALMFGKYHNLMEYSLSDSYNDGGYYYRFSTCRFDEISIWASFDVYFGESNEPEGWNFSCAVQPAYYY